MHRHIWRPLRDFLQESAALCVDGTRRANVTPECASDRLRQSWVTFWRSLKCHEHVVHAERTSKTKTRSGCSNYFLARLISVNIRLISQLQTSVGMKSWECSSIFCCTVVTKLSPSLYGQKKNQTPTFNHVDKPRRLMVEPSIIWNTLDNHVNG